MVGFVQAMLDPVRFAYHFEPRWPRDDGTSISRLLGELDAVFCQDCMDPVRDDLQQVLEELPRRPPISAAVEACNRCIAARTACVVVALP